MTAYALFLCPSFVTYGCIPSSEHKSCNVDICNEIPSCRFYVTVGGSPRVTEKTAVAALWECRWDTGLRY